MLSTAAILRINRDRIQDLHREAERMTAVRCARRALKLASASRRAVGATVAPCRTPVQACC